MEGKQFSTSRGYSIYVRDFLERYDADALRYYLVAAGPETQDTDFTWAEFVRRNNDELLANWGNLVNRTLTNAHRNFGEVPQPGELTDTDRALLATIDAGFESVGALIERGRFRAALGEAMRLSSEVNQYVSDQAPWALVKTDRDRAGTVLYVSLLAVDSLKVLFTPFLPAQLAGAARAARLRRLARRPARVPNRRGGGRPGARCPHRRVRRMDGQLAAERASARARSSASRRRSSRSSTSRSSTTSSAARDRHARAPRPRRGPGDSRARPRRRRRPRDRGRDQDRRRPRRARARRRARRRLRLPRHPSPQRERARCASPRRATRAARPRTRCRGRGDGPRLLPPVRAPRRAAPSLRGPARARRRAREAGRDPHPRRRRGHARRAPAHRRQGRPALLLVAGPARAGARARLVRLVRRQRHVPQGAGAARGGAPRAPATASSPRPTARTSRRSRFAGSPTSRRT